MGLFVTGLLIALGILLVLFFLFLFPSIMKIKNEDPTFWERSIRKFEKEDEIKINPENSILFTGSLRYVILPFLGVAPSSQVSSKKSYSMICVGLSVDDAFFVKVLVVSAKIVRGSNGAV